MNPAVSTKRLPVTVMPGFLGAGKTTLLNQNDMSEDNDDAALAKSSDANVSPAEDQLNSITSHGPESSLESDSAVTSGWQDWIGIVASIGCAIHCAAMPFVIAFLPTLGLSFLADEAFHRWMALACFLIALAAFVPGFRQHRRWAPAAIAIVGLSLITVAAFGITGDCCAACASPAATEVAAATCTESWCEHCAVNAPVGSESIAESNTGIVTASVASPSLLTGLTPWITPLGGIMLVSAHLLNRRYGYLCGCCVTKTR